MSFADLRPWADGRASTLPLLVIHVTEACDSRCIGCSYGSSPGPVMDAARAAALARDADALGTRAVLVTGGEPLTVPHLEELVAPFRSSSRRLYLATSGTRLPERADLVVRLFDEVFVSLDGPDAARHDAIRGVPTFDALRRGVAALKERASIPVTARTTVSGRNAGDVAAIVRTSRALGIDRISFLPVDAWSGAFGRGTTPPPVDLLPTAEQVEALRASLPAIEEELGPELIPNLEHVIAHLRAALGLTGYPAKRCNTPMVSAVVEPDGTVRPCFFKAPLGRIDGGGLHAVLQSSAAVALRRSLDTTTDPDCLRCVCPKYFPLRSLLMGKVL